MKNIKVELIFKIPKHFTGKKRKDITRAVACRFDDDLWIRDLSADTYTGTVLSLKNIKVK